MCSPHARDFWRRGMWASGAILLLTVILSIVVTAQVRRLRLVSTVWAPFTNQPGQARIALDLVDTALKRLEIAADTAFVEESRYTIALLSSEFDGSAAAWRDPEREQYLVYSQPYLENRLILVGRRGSDVSATTLASLKGKTIAIVGGYSYGDAVEATSGPSYVRSRVRRTASRDY